MDPVVLWFLVSLGTWILGILLGFALTTTFQGYVDECEGGLITFWPLTLAACLIYGIGWCLILRSIYWLIILWVEWGIKLFNPSYNVKENFLKHIKWKGY